MKRMNFFYALFLLVSLSFLTSCSDDDARRTKTNEITVGQNRFEISEAKLFNDGVFNGITEFELYITSTGLTIDDNYNFSGSGDFLSLRLFSGGASGLETGNYLYNDQDANTFILNGGSHFFGYDATLGDNKPENIGVESGSISVTVENNVYTITINLVDEDGNTITGYYNGSITLVD